MDHRQWYPLKWYARLKVVGALFDRAWIIGSGISHVFFRTRAEARSAAGGSVRVAVGTPVFCPSKPWQI
jgi:hypothetical protein